MIRDILVAAQGDEGDESVFATALVFAAPLQAHLDFYHVWVTPDLVGKLKRQIVLKDARDWPQSSDHVPVCVELRL